MKVLIVDDDFHSRKLMHLILAPYGHCGIAVNGEEAIQAFKLAWHEKQPFDLICLDSMMPELDGRKALKKIREKEKAQGIRAVDEVKVIMTTALGIRETWSMRSTRKVLPSIPSNPSITRSF